MEQQLFNAADEDKINEVVRILTENPSININQLCKIHEGQRWKATPLYIASKNCNTDIVEFLLKQPGIDVNKKSVAGETPLYISSKYDCSEIVSLLLINNADINLANDFGSTPLHAASSINSQDAVDILLKNGADLNIKENLFGKTPLHTALENSHIEIADALIVAGSDINSKNKNGKTSLFSACEKSKIEIINFLLSRGANLYDKNNDGLTCFDVANEDVTRILKQWSTTMLIDMLKENHAYGDLENIQDFYEYHGGKKRKTIRKKNKKRKTIRKKTFSR